MCTCICPGLKKLNHIVRLGVLNVKRRLFLVECRECVCPADADDVVVVVMFEGHGGQTLPCSRAGPGGGGGEAVGVSG